MDEERFSVREGFRYVPDQLTYDKLTTPVIQGIINEISILVTGHIPALADTSSGLTLHLYRIACRQTRTPFRSDSALLHDISLLRDHVVPVLRSADWYQIFDILEEWIHVISPAMKGDQFVRSLTVQINRLFVEERVGWELDGGRFRRRQDTVTASRLREATNILKELKFRPTDQLWGKAVDALNRRPHPDIENCIKDAVAAVESIANVMAGTTGETLDKAIDNLANHNRLPKPLHNTLKHPYYYRGNQPGVAHGTGEPLSATVVDAEFVLNWAAASIIYLSKI